TIGGIRAARAVAAVSPGEFRELVTDADGAVREPVMLPVPASGGAPFPLSQDDVVLVSRDSGTAGVVFAQVAACAGAAVVVVGHGTGQLPHLAVADLTDDAMLLHQREAAAALANLLGAVAPDQLRLIATFGSAAARHGLASEGAQALASAALAGHGQQLAAGL